jgi:hypothetical protein
MEGLLSELKDLVHHHHWPCCALIVELYALDCQPL